MKKAFRKMFAALTCAAIVAVPAVGLAACSSGEYDTTNTIFLYPINYYGIEGKAFTSRWDGMAGAMEDNGWDISGDGQKDSKQFVATRLDSCTMPEDTEVVFVNNQTWDVSLALTDKLVEYQPLVILSLCNGAKFCSEQIAAYSPGTQNVTYASFSDDYKEEFANGTVNYMASKYTSSIAPIVAAVYKAVTTGSKYTDGNGDALALSQEYWMVDSYDTYCEMEQYDLHDVSFGEQATIMKADMDGLDTYDEFAEFVSTYTASYEGVKSLVEKHESEGTADTAADTDEFTIGLLVPSSINDSVQAYIDFIEGYLAEAYNYTVKTYSVSSTVSQETACENACNANCDAIISLQDDTDRAAACETANEAGIWFAVAGSCVSDYESDSETEWDQMNACEYYVGSIGTSLDAEYQAGYDLVQIYIDIINERGVIGDTVDEELAVTDETGLRKETY